LNLKGVEKMDDVPIVSSGPVKNVFVPPAPPVGKLSKPKAPGTFITFFLVMPFAGIILIQAFFFGKAIGEYTTFPIHTFQTYFNLAALLSLMVVMQVLMRSIVYSTLFGFMLLAGIFHTWFGEFWIPLMDNFKEVVSILKSSWKQKDIPFPLLMSTIMTLLLVGTVGANFIFSLFTKYFFEMVFGRDWSDGKRNAFVTGILLLAILHAGLAVYSRGVGNTSVLVWSQRSIYKPLEEFCAKIPSGTQVTKSSIANFDPFSISTFDPKTGNLMKNHEISASILTPTWSKLDSVIIGTKLGLISFDKDLLFQTWICKFPVEIPLASIPGLTSETGKKGEMDSALENPADIGVPLVLRTDLSKDMVLAMFDYGFWGAISCADGKLQWLKLIDTPSKVNKIFLEDFTKNPWVLVEKDLVVFSCYNGRIACVKSATGEMVWEYSHKETKFSGKGQRAFLSTQNNRVYAAFPSGTIVTLDLLKGIKIYEAHGAGKWNPNSAVSVDGYDASFIALDGSFVQVQLDGGTVVMQHPLFENPLPLMPTPFDLSSGFAGYKENFYAISTATRTISPIIKFPNHLFAAKPVVDGQFVYTGTQDGWVFCLHKASHDEKWRFHVSGELTEDSLCITEAGLLVRTRSGSLFCLKKGIL